MTLFGVVVQGHALYTRQAGSTIPCPYVDYDKGFNAVFARAYGLKDGETIAKLFGSDWGKLGWNKGTLLCPLASPLWGFSCPASRAASCPDSSSAMQNLSILGVHCNYSSNAGFVQVLPQQSACVSVIAAVPGRPSAKLPT